MQTYRLQTLQTSGSLVSAVMQHDNSTILQVKLNNKPRCPRNCEKPLHESPVVVNCHDQPQIVYCPNYPPLALTTGSVPHEHLPARTGRSAP